VSERPKVGLAVFIRRNGTSLFGQRLSEHGGGSWCPPGGHLEFGEDFEACARREVMEECGLTITTPKLAFVTNDIFPTGKHYITLHLVADYIEGEAKVCEPDKMAHWQWFKWPEVPEPLFLSPRLALESGFNPLTAGFTKLC
jgi:8-oxo-dGTP diphosphatase